MQDLGKLLLRWMVGGLMAFHGWAKVQSDSGISGIKAMVVAKSLPEFVAYGVYVGELAAPALLILGFFTRGAALILAINMAVAVWLAHADDLLRLTSHGTYALELHAFYFVGALAILCLGPGRIALQGEAPSVAE